MASKVAIDNVPTVARPAEVERAISEAHELRERARAQAEAVAAAQRTVDEREREDVEAAAARARAGEPLGVASRALTKARDQLMLAQRDLNAIRLAQEQAEGEVMAAIAEHGESWAVELGGEAEQAREAGRAAVAALEDACARLNEVGSARNWIAASSRDGRFDQLLRGVITASIAPSSKGRTANSEPLGRGELLDYVRELLDPPLPPAPKTLRVETPEPLDDIERAAVRR